MPPTKRRKSSRLTPREELIKILTTYEVPFDVAIEAEKMVHDDDTSLRDLGNKIATAAARTLYAMAWADREENAGRRAGGPGQDILDVAPRTSRAAEKATHAWLDKLTAANGLPLPLLYLMAKNASGKHDKRPTPEAFGSDLAMMGTGTGVSWFDDHPKFNLKVPHVEFSL